FFVSVERLLNRSLIGQPVVVGGRPGERGVVTAASYEVRKLGVHSGMPMTEAFRLAPKAIFVPCRHQTYGPYAKKVRAILEDFTPAVTTASIDEFFLDFRGCEALYRQHGDRTDDATIERTVHEIRERIQQDVGLPASAGIGATRPIAKIASGLAKPAGVLMVPVGTEVAFLTPLSVRKYPGIGPVGEARLNAANIHTMGQLLTLPPGPLRQRFGSLSLAIHRNIDGSQPRRSTQDRPAFLEFDPTGLSVGSISNERTFRTDLGDKQHVKDQLRKLAERVCWRARQRNVRARTITLKLRYSDFHTITRSQSGTATNTENLVYQRVLNLLRTAWTRRLPIRLLGVALSNLEQNPSQMPLPFQAETPDIGCAIDTIRSKYGYDAIRLGSLKGGRPPVRIE
ncbi:MAG: DNA polymerase IV, partial [Proteobacteria bacterium]|nr:DNA polymerase IV [Pseudomonadota bacterium]